MTLIERCKLFARRGFRYDPATGDFFGLKGHGLKSKNDRGYTLLAVREDGKRYSILGHQFAWWMVYKKFNNGEIIDHKDRNPLNNKISNLRSTTQTENILNSDLKDLSKGYSFHKQSGKWLSRIYIDGERIYLGLFDTEEEARQAYLDALKIYYPERYKKIKGQSNEN